MKHRVYILAFVLTLLTHGAAAANQPSSAQPQANPLGGMVFSGAHHCCVGIGTASPAANLDVYQGEVRVGSSGVGCSGNNAGSVRYADRHLQLCDGASWRNVSLDKAE